MSKTPQHGLWVAFAICWLRLSRLTCICILWLLRLWMGWEIRRELRQIVAGRSRILRSNLVVAIMMRMGMRVRVVLCHLIIKVLLRRWCARRRGEKKVSILFLWLYADETGFSGSNEANYRTAAYQAIAAYLGQATPDSLAFVSNVLDSVLARMEHLIPIYVSQPMYFDTFLNRWLNWIPESNHRYRWS